MIIYFFSVYYFVNVFWRWPNFSYQSKSFGSGPPFGPPGPRKAKILNFLFLNVEPSKFDMTLIFGPWFHIIWKILVRGPPLARPGPRKVKILKFLFLNVEPSNFDMTLILGPWFHISWKILVWAPRLARPGPRNVKIFVFVCRTFKIWYSTKIWFCHYTSKMISEAI